MWHSRSTSQPVGSSGETADGFYIAGPARLRIESHRTVHGSAKKKDGRPVGAAVQDLLRFADAKRAAALAIAGAGDPLNAGTAGTLASVRARGGPLGDHRRTALPPDLQLPLFLGRLIRGRGLGCGLLLHQVGLLHLADHGHLLQLNLHAG